MSLPIFFEDLTDVQEDVLQLTEDTSRHCIQVLRMKVGDNLQITNGRGLLLTARITVEHKKNARAWVIERKIAQPVAHPKCVAISLVKNSSRLEWFLEKATEIGINQIVPLICTRTEKQHFRVDRMRNILVSAMLQSRQVWLPVMEAPQPFEQVIIQNGFDQKFIAHCLDTGKQPLSAIADKNRSAIVLIGPEGDFTQEEIDGALHAGYLPVTLGETRLRTETAGLVASVNLMV